MKNFQKFLEEINIKGNPGIPGEPNKKTGESSYVSDVERRAERRLGVRQGDMRAIQRLVERLMGELVPQSMQMSNGKEDELSKLATDVFMNIYSELIERYEIEVDIKIIKPGKVKKWMDECEECEPPTPPQYEDITDEDIKNEVHKRKIANLIIQGEAKNTKHILHTDEVKDGLTEIFGEANGKRIFAIWDEISKTAEKLDWLVPIEDRARMMQERPEGLAGACHVDWKPKEKNEDEEEEEQEEKEYSLEDEEGEEEESNLPAEDLGQTPILRARGIDFTMLLHEAVKGLFEILSLNGIPEDKKIAQIALLNTGLDDEPEDWKYGPEVASDLRDFVNLNTKIDTYPNIREELFKLMIDKETMPTAKFLELMRGILSKTDKARSDVDKLIDQVIETIKIEKDEINRYNREMDDYEGRMKDFKSQQDKPKEDDLDDIDKLIRNANKKSDDGDDIDTLIKNANTKQDTSDDYATWSKKDLEDAMNAAIDDGDFKKAHLINSFMEGVSKDLYERELKILNESINLHSK